MKNILFITALIASTGLLTSCAGDLTVEPTEGTGHTQTSHTYENSYAIDVQVYSSLDMPMETDERGQINTVKLTGVGNGTSQTFGDVSTDVELYYGTEDGKLYGTVKMYVPSTDEELVLRVDEKTQVLSFESLESNCLSALSSKQFAGMDFNGNVCLTDFPSSLAEVGTQDIAFQITGTLK